MNDDIFSEEDRLNQERLAEKKRKRAQITGLYDSLPPEKKKLAIKKEEPTETEVEQKEVKEEVKEVKEEVKEEREYSREEVVELITKLAKHISSPKKFIKGVATAQKILATPNLLDDKKIGLEWYGLLEGAIMKGSQLFSLPELPSEPRQALHDLFVDTDSRRVILRGISKDKQDRFNCWLLYAITGHQMLIAEDSFALHKHVEQLKERIVQLAEKAKSAGSNETEKKKLNEDPRRKRWCNASFYCLNIAWSLRALLWAKPLVKQLIQIACDNRDLVFNETQASAIAQWLQILKGTHASASIKAPRSTSWDRAHEFWRSAEVSKYGEN